MRCNAGRLELFSTVRDSRFQRLETTAAASSDGLARRLKMMPSGLGIHAFFITSR